MKGKDGNRGKNPKILRLRQPTLMNSCFLIQNCRPKGGENFEDQLFLTSRKPKKKHCTDLRLFETINVSIYKGAVAFKVDT